MIISRGRRFIFVHIPKTGGTAMSLALEARAMRDDILIGDTPKARARRRRLQGVNSAGRLWKHSTLSDIQGLISSEEIARYFVFTLVRNPWDRVVSYYHWLQVQRFDHPAVALAQSLSFSAFLSAPQIAAALTRWPYNAYLRGPGGRERCNLFIRLEHLEQDLPPLSTHLGFSLGPLKRVNASARARDWRIYYRDQDAEVVARLCAADIRRFSYRFDGDSS